MKRIAEIGWKFVKGVLWTVFGILIVLNLLILLSGKYYLYNGIRHTYLQGKTGPGIYDLNIFYNDTIEHDPKMYPLHRFKSVNRYKFNSRDQALMSSLDTRAFLVLKGDSLLFENYANGHTPETVSNSFSAAKTLVAMLIAIAVEEGNIKSLDEPVGNYLPAFRNGEKKRITIRHLLTMSSGLDWEESASNPLSENAESYYGTDLFELVNRQQAVTAPGNKFVYQSGNSQLLGYVLEKATGKSVSEYTEQKIWKKIGTEGHAYWSLDKQNGDEKSFCCFYATARDFARLGLLIHRGGRWGKDQVVPAWFIKEMSVPTPMATEEGVPNYRYGLHVWTYPEKDQTITYCRGIKGQYIISIPKEDLVVVRLGMKRKDNVDLSEVRSDRNVKKVGHPQDFFEYLRIAREIARKK
jgi:CubicO group peptidase (beta-lactamase class C family)